MFESLLVSIVMADGARWHLNLLGPGVGGAVGLLVAGAVMALRSAGRGRRSGTDPGEWLEGHAEADAAALWGVRVR